MSDEQALPNGWIWTTLGEVKLDLSKGIQPANYPEVVFELYSVPSYDNNRPELVSGKSIGSNKQIITPGTVLLCKINPHINRVWVVGMFSEQEKIASTEWIPFFPIDNVEPKYLRYYLTLSTVREYLASHASGVGGSLMRITPRTITDYPFPLAPLAEQRRIVAAIEQQFTRLDAGVAALRRAQAALKRYRASVLKAAVEGRLTTAWRATHPDAEPASQLLARILTERRARWEADQRTKGKDPAKASYPAPAAPDATQLPTLPDGWAWSTVEQLAALITSGSRGWADYYCNENDAPLFIRAQDLNTDNLNLKSVAHVMLPETVEGLRTRVQTSDLLVTITGANVTKTAIVRQMLDEAYVSQHVGLVRLVSVDCAPYVYLWVIAPSHGRKVLEAMAYGAGKPGLNLNNLRELTVALPPLAEQEQIVAEVERRLSVVSELEAALTANLKRAERLRQSILREAFAGRLVPQDASDEPASMLLERIRREREEQPGVSGRNGTSRRAHSNGETGARATGEDRQRSLWEV